MLMRTLPVLFTCLCALRPAGAADWPQWRGPERSDISKETGLLKNWPKDGPPLLWSYSSAGIGYSGPAIVGDRLFTMGGRGDDEYVFAIDTKAGKEVWSTRIGAFFQNGYGGGPRGTPTVDGAFLYALGGQGELACLEAATGKKHWSVNLIGKEIGGERPGWRYTESPLVDKDRVVCSPGGAGGTFAAFDPKTGKLIWRSKELKDPPGYSSLVVADVGGVRQYVKTTMKGVAGVAAKDGKLLWHYPKPEYRTAVVPTPILHENYVFVAAGYGAGCDLIRLSPDGQGTKAEKVYSSKDMDNKHGGVVLVGDYLYGWSDRDRGRWICQEFKTAKVVWEEKKLRRGCLTFADGHLYCYSEENGTAVLVDAVPSGWQEDGRFKIPKETTLRSPRGGVWTHPVIANGRLYLRDQDLIFCFDIRDRAVSTR